MIKITHLKEVGRILDAWLPGKIFYDQTPGIAVAVAHKGKLVYSKGFGLADIESKRAVTPETNFRVASISKMFTAVALLQLAEQKKLKLTDPIGKHLSWVKGPVAKRTIKQILSHTGGMLRDGDTHWNEHVFPTADEFRDSIIRREVVPSYQNKFKYSNFAFSLLGEVIENVTRTPYAKYVMENVIIPAGMRNTFPDFTEPVRATIATGYSRVIPGMERESFPHVATKAFGPSAGFISNVVDLTAFATALMKPNKLLSAQSFLLMTKEVSKTGKAKLGYALGCGTAEIEGAAIRGHGGGFSGFISRIAFDAKNGISVVVLTNSIDGAAREIADGIFRTIYTAPALIKKYGKRNIANATQYENVYRERWWDMVIANAGKCLFAFNPKTNSPLEDASTLVEKEKGVFVINNKNGQGSVGENVVFESDHIQWGAIRMDKIQL